MIYTVDDSWHFKAIVLSKDMKKSYYLWEKPYFLQKNNCTSFRACLSSVKVRPQDSDKHLYNQYSWFWSRPIANETIENIQIFVMNMTFISSSEVKNIYFMSGEATNEVHNSFTSRDEI